MRPLIAILLLASFTAVAQMMGQNVAREPNDTYTLSVKSQLVVETVVVKDKNGKSIDGLTSKDFTVIEDGTPQTIRFCSYQQFGNEPLREILPAAPEKPENIKIYKQLVRTQIAPEVGGTTKFKDRRLLVLYFDMSSMPPHDQMRALAAGEKFIRMQMVPADRIAIMRYAGGSVDVLQDFTDNRDRLLSILETMIVGEGQGTEEMSSDASASDSGAAFGQDSSEFNIFNTDRQLSALQTAVQVLGRLNEKKSLIYFASGMRLNGINNQAQLHSTIDAAVRAGVSFWPIDARGLTAEAPLGDATKGSQGGIGMYSGTSTQAVTSNFQQSQDTLYALGEDTGGKALLDNNDLTKGIVQAQQSISSYYIVGYYTTNTDLDGKFRHVKITVNPSLEAKLEFRQGYYAAKVFAKFTEADKERQLEEALMLEDPITDVTIAMEINYFQLNRAEYFVPIMVKIPGRELALAKKGGAEHTLIDLIGEVKDYYGGATITNIHDKVNIKLTSAEAAEWAKVPVEYDTGFTLLPGKYTIKVLARDDETGRIGTYQTMFMIPNLNKEEERIPISSVVLSSELQTMKDALYNAEKEKQQAKDAAANPLIVDGQKMIPSVMKVFSRSKEMYVYLQAYEQELQTVQPLIGFVTFYHGETKIFESRPVEAMNAINLRLKTVPLRFSIPLNQIPPGEYKCQVTILDPARQKGTFWQTPIVIVP